MTRIALVGYVLAVTMDERGNPWTRYCSQFLKPAAS